MPDAHRGRHFRATLGIAFTALVWGGSFAAMKAVVQGGLSVGALLSFRFLLGTALLLGLALVLKARWDRQSVRDGLLLGLVLTVIFWLQTDGLRYTTTSKSGFITGLYVIFTPVVSLVVGDRLRSAHALGALCAALGLYFLVNEPGKPFGGWNFGDSETLLCAVLCGVHISMTAHFSRRSDGWVLATLQVAVVALLSLAITPFAPTQALADGSRLGGFSGSLAALARPLVWISMLFLAVLATCVAFYLQASQQAHLGATEAAILFSLEPVFSAALAVSGWVPGIREHLSLLQVLGGALIVLGLLWAELGPRILARGAPEEEAIG
ncbi:MAG: DMT family transporter [Acidobacteria bacterium]|nr:DMT family transporter [Acidobacteriota bacterium]